MRTLHELTSICASLLLWGTQAVPYPMPLLTCPLEEADEIVVSFPPDFMVPGAIQTTLLPENTKYFPDVFRLLNI